MESRGNRRYMVRFMDGKGNFRDVEAGANTRPKAARVATRKLRDLIGEEYRNWEAARITFMGAPRPSGG